MRIENTIGMSRRHETYESVIILTDNKVLNYQRFRFLRLYSIGVGGGASAGGSRRPVSPAANLVSIARVRDLDTLDVSGEFAKSGEAAAAASAVALVPLKVGRKP